MRVGFISLQDLLEGSLTMTAPDRSRALTILATLLLVAAVGVLSPNRVSAQPQSLPVDLPDGPALDGFDLDRFSNAGNGWFETFHVEETEPLSEALEDDRVAADTLLLVIETATGPLAFLRDQMAFHHIAQGRAGGKDWMATF
ncbi:MAG: hypothetical protein QF463_09400 [Vicinamibacterales bacterium]|jgi:hypothetical protein|nr:hypothetical protein [Acidobacteriota bacterium]MDP6609269.1 hypothetical protein [Vicinamibacterales bacterium]|tara:strand:- start:3774 stop:4202 length:429 start_codon:yes stop_codon:yes gene_type:complete